VIDSPDERSASDDDAPTGAEGDVSTPLDWRSRLEVVAGTTAIRVLGATWRYRQLDFDRLQVVRRRGGGRIYAFWHAQMLAFLTLHRTERPAVLISTHRDGERIARAAVRLGLRSIRGSTSRGGAGALRALVRALHEGWEIAVTPDGPRGPAEQFAPGVVIAAHQAGVPVVLMAAAADRAWRLASWDRFIIPKPFSRITVAYSEPFMVPGDSARAAAETAADFQDKLVALNAVARGA
jgi:lysophospholipid acyltransferase (LPLAT)-like uncharacterized protein